MAENQGLTSARKDTTSKLTNSQMKCDKLNIASSEIQSLKFTWKIPEYSPTPDRDFALNSPPFNFANATWCIQLLPNEHLGPFLAVIRQHSLIWCHKIICNFDIVGMKDDFSFKTLNYGKLKFNEDFRKRKYFIGQLSDRLVDSPDEPLTVIGHFFCKQSKQEENLQCEGNFSDMYRRQCEQSTGILSLKFSNAQSLKIKWEIPEYFSLPETVGYSLNSPAFDFGLATWFFKLYPNGTGDNSDTIVSLVRSRSQMPLCHEIIYVCDVIYDRRNHFNHSEYGELSFTEDCEIIDPYFPFENRSVMFEDHRVSAPDGILTFYYCLYYEPSEVKDEAIQKMSRELDMYRKFGQDLKNLLLSGRDHDLVLKVKGKEFKVHRHILSVRSPVFESMLTHDMAEKNSGIVNISDCDPDVMEQLLSYVYSGKVESVNEDNVLELYYIADKYEMVQLKEVCYAFIQKSLSCSNFCDIAQLAMTHNDEDLENAILEFFVRNSDKISATEEWISFVKENGDIANEMLSKASKKAAEKNDTSEIKKKK